MQYKDGTVSVINGSATVTGSGTLWNNGDIQPGQLFGIKGEGVFYSIAAVVSNTEMTLNANYAGGTASGQNYYISVGFTPNRNYPEISPSDWEKEGLITDGFRMIDADVQDLIDRVTALEGM